MQGTDEDELYRHGNTFSEAVSSSQILHRIHVVLTLSFHCGLLHVHCAHCA